LQDRATALCTKADPKPAGAECLGGCDGQQGHASEYGLLHHRDNAGGTPSHPAADSPNTRSGMRALAERDREFESTSLQRRVINEPVLARGLPTKPQILSASAKPGCLILRASGSRFSAPTHAALRTPAIEAQVILSLPEIFPFTGAYPAGLFISDHGGNRQPDITVPIIAPFRCGYTSPAHCGAKALGYSLSQGPRAKET